MHPERPSTTATMIALGLLSLHARRDAYSVLSDDDARLLNEALRRAGGMRGIAARLSTTPALRPLASAVEWAIAPGTSRHFGARKQLIGSITRELIAAGVGRVVVLAAGLDLLSLHLVRTSPGVRVIEVDHPATHAIKRRMYARAGEPAARVDLISADLRDPRWADAVRPKLEPVLPTLFIAEGLSMYLTDEQWGCLMRTLARLPGAAHLVFTFLTPDARGGGRAHLATQRAFLPGLLARLHEPFKWGSTPEALPAFVDAHAWRVERVLGPESLSTPFAGEYIAHCTR